MQRRGLDRGVTRIHPSLPAKMLGTNFASLFHATPTLRRTRILVPHSAHHLLAIFGNGASLTGSKERRTDLGF